MIRILHSPKGNQTPSPQLAPSPSFSGGSINIMDESPLVVSRPQNNLQLRDRVNSGESEDYDSEQENQTLANSSASKGVRKLSASRRAAHLESEKKRRQNINVGFEDLRQLVPYCTELDSKAEILRKSADYIRQLKKGEGYDADSMSVTSEEETLAKSLTLLRSRSKSAN